MTATVAERLYYTSAELDFEAVVTDIRLDSKDGSGQLWQVALDRTGFYPEGGGQPWDTGVLVAVARSGATLEVPVERVEEDEAGEVWHYVRKPLVQGTEVTGRIDAARRVDHEQQHSGQHLLSAVFWRELGSRTVSFHLGSESSTIDLVLGEGAERLTEEYLRHVSTAANVIVTEARPLMSHWVEPEMAQAMLARGDLRKLPERVGRMRIVQMQGIEFNACGGTHVANTGAIGAIALRRVEKVKQGWRVEFVCGLRAVAAARADYTLLSGLASGLSVGVSEMPARVAALQEQIKAASKEQRAVLEELAGLQASARVAAAGSGPVQAIFAGRDVDFAKRVASRVAAAGRVAVIGATNEAAGAVVLARPAGSEVHAGNLMREVLSAAGARGGGSAEMAQGVCDADSVSELVKTLNARLG